MEPPLENPDHTIKYVGAYTHRVAISNHRIIDLSDGKVTFSYKHRSKGTVEVAVVDVVEVIRRFLLHVLPKGLMRIRYFGFVANRNKRESLAKCRKLLDADEPIIPDMQRNENTARISKNRGPPRLKQANLIFTIPIYIGILSMLETQWCGSVQLTEKRLS